jgi:RNA polymerase sigma-54 factor
MLKVIQQLDPPGIAASDLKECLLIQLNRIGKPF